MALGNKSDIDLLVSCIRNSVIVTNDETGQCEVIPPPPASDAGDIAKLMEMYVVVLLPFNKSMLIMLVMTVEHAVENFLKFGVRDRVPEGSPLVCGDT